MRTVFMRVSICLLGVWLAAFMPLTVSAHHHHDPGRISGIPVVHSDPDPGANPSTGGICDICARLLLPVDFAAPRSCEPLSGIRGISFIGNDIPAPSQLVSTLKDRSPPAAAVCS